MKWILFLLVFVCLISPCMAFEDGFQKHPSDDLTQGDESNIWTIYTQGVQPESIVEIIQSGVPYNNVMKLYIVAPGATPYTASAYNSYGHSSDYFSFKHTYHNDGSALAGSEYSVYMYDEDGILIGEYDLTSRIVDYSGVTSSTIFLIELQRSSNSIYMYINGVLQGGSLGAATSQPYYFKIVNSGSWKQFNVDGVSTDGFVLEIGTEGSPESWVNTATNNRIDVEWTVKTIDPYGNWDDSTYQMRVTWLDAGNVTSTTTLSKTVPHGFVVYNRSVLMPKPNYGTYRFDLLKDSVIMESDYLTFLPIGSSGSLAWDKSSYVPYQNASVTWAVTPFTPADYSYYIKTYNINTGLVDTNQLAANTGTLTESLDAWATGSYYSLLNIVDKSDGTEYSVAYDVFDINNEVRFEGITYDAENGIALGSTNVSFLQALSYYNDTSNATGYYELSKLTDSLPIEITATKTNFIHEDFTFTPPTARMFDLNLYLFPTTRTLNNTSIVEGMTVDYPSHQALGSATVNLYNATWSNTTTSNTFGYYQFNLSELTNGTYYVNSTLSGYHDSSEYTITVTENESTVQNIVLRRKYTLTVTATDSKTSALLQTFTATVDGTIQSVSGGTATFNLEYGLYTVNVASEGYYPGSTNTLLDQNRSVSVSLTPIVTDYYDPAHYVEFILTALNGTRYPNVEVNVYIGDSTTVLFTNTTDSLGSVVFEMDQNVKYRLTFIDTTLGINEEITVFPVDTKYYIYIDESVTFDPMNVSTELTNYTTNYTTRSWSLQNLTSAEVNSTIGLGLLGQGIVASVVLWVVVGAGGLAVGFIAICGLAMLGIVTWIMVLFCTMTAVSLYILGSRIQ